MNNAPIYSAILEDEPELAPIVGRFVQRLPTVLGDMAEAWRQRDWARLRGVAHELKGTAGNLGYPALMQTADRIETHAKRQENAGIDQLLDELKGIAARVAPQP
jgi:HPt (histidine-containing phosphotransfer) domain-containing protein